MIRTAAMAILLATSFVTNASEPAKAKADPAKGNKMDFAGFMRGYTQFFGTAAQPNLPARSAFQIAALANPAWYVEIEVVAVRATKPVK